MIPQALATSSTFLPCESLASLIRTVALRAKQLLLLFQPDCLGLGHCDPVLLLDGKTVPGKEGQTDAFPDPVTELDIVQEQDGVAATACPLA